MLECRGTGGPVLIVGLPTAPGTPISLFGRRHPHTTPAFSDKRGGEKRRVNQRPSPARGWVQVLRLGDGRKTGLPQRQEPKCWDEPVLVDRSSCRSAKSLFPTPSLSGTPAGVSSGGDDTYTLTSTTRNARTQTKQTDAAEDSLDSFQGGINIMRVRKIACRRVVSSPAFGDALGA